MQPGMSRISKVTLFMVIAILIGVAVTNVVGSASLLGMKAPEQIPFSELFQRKDRIQSITIQADSGVIHGEYLDGNRFESQGPSSSSPVWSDLEHWSVEGQHPITVSFARPSTGSRLIGLFSIMALPLILFAMVLLVVNAAARKFRQ
jgi:hypothetical protein